jgi:hypothetical protein
MMVDKHGADSLGLHIPSETSTRRLAPSPHPPPWRVKDEIRVRRDTVKDLKGAGYTNAAIAKRLGLSLVTIDRDTAFLHQQAREEYQRHIQERIPYEVETTLALYKRIKREAIELAENTNSERVKVAALSLAKDAGKEAMDLELRGEYVKRAMDAATEIKERLDKLPHYYEQQEQEQEQRSSLSSSPSSESNQQQTKDEIEVVDEDEEEGEQQKEQKEQKEQQAYDRSQ